MLESNKCYVLDCGAEIFIWMGRITSLEERKAASILAEVRTKSICSFVELSFIFLYSIVPLWSLVLFFSIHVVIRSPQEFLSSQKRPKQTLLTKIMQGFETLIFRSNFDAWPLGGGATTSEEGRGKVAGAYQLTNYMLVVLPESSI